MFCTRTACFLVYFAAKTRAIAIPSDLELQIANLFGRQQLVMKHTKQWLSARNRRDMMSTTRDATAASDAPASGAASAAPHPNPNANAASPQLSMSASTTVPPTPAFSLSTATSMSMSMSISSSRHHFADLVQSSTLVHQPSVVGWNNDYRCAPSLETLLFFFCRIIQCFMYIRMFRVHSVHLI